MQTIRRPPLLSLDNLILNATWHLFISSLAVGLASHVDFISLGKKETSCSRKLSFDMNEGPKSRPDLSALQKEAFVINKEVCTEHMVRPPF